MLRFHATLCAGLATLFVAPALFAGTDELETLEAALQATSRALDVMPGIQRGVVGNPAEGPALVRRVTEAPILDARKRDERLATLREEVNLLRTELDLLEPAAMASGAPAYPAAATKARNATKGMPTSVPGELQPISTGLDVATREALERLAAGASRKGGSSVGPTNAGGTSAARGDSAEGTYSADPVRHARACYRAGRYAEGAALLSGLDGDAAALFWRARCRERIGQLVESEADLRALLALEPEGPFSERARQDLEFLEWKRSFLERMQNEGGRER